jgi:asparagine synthase (glutamine-hydrolysing)
MAPAEPAARLPKAFLAVSSAAGTSLDPCGPGGELRVRAAAAMLTDACPGPPPAAQSSQARALHARAPQGLAELARSTAGLLRGVSRDYLDEHPDLVLQLSGGLDSRIQLAAIPPARRAGSGPSPWKSAAARIA